MPYPVIFEAPAAAATARLPAPVQETLSEALLDACQDPWAIPRLSDQRPPEERLLTWDHDRGLAILLIDEEHDPEPSLLLLAITWT